MGIAKALPPLEVLDALFRASPSKGVLIHKQGKNAGKNAGWKSANGYIIVHVAGYGEYPAHRVLYCLYHKTILPPEVIIDHRDRDKTNNRKRNLRDSTTRLNARNTKLCSRSTSGVAGVNWCKRSRAWIARAVDKEGNRVYLGRSHDLAIATAMRKRAERKFGYSNDHGEAS